jgi:uncharacterized membrane protein (UPF0127 family)
MIGFVAKLARGGLGGAARCLLVVIGLLLGLGGAPHAARADSLVIHAGGSAYKFAVELAVTPDQREQGLMFRQSMAANAGMLFIYPQPQPVEFWMKNTLIPLDMLFIRQDGTIARIAAEAVPGDETPIPSGEPVRAVLEINGGVAATLGIKAGDRVEYKGADLVLGGS